jgi:hypothetical protein
MIADQWFKSSLSGENGDCVEVRFRPATKTVEVRHSKDRGGPVLVFTDSEWQAFTGGVHGGEFEIPNS